MNRTLPAGSTVVPVTLPGLRYEILIGRGLIDEPVAWEGCPQSTQALIVSNSTVAPLLAGRLGALAQPLTGLVNAVQAFEKQLEVEHSLPPEGDEGNGHDDAAGKLALARAIAGTADEGGMLRIVSQTLEARSRRHFSPVHVRARLDQVDELAARLDEARLQAAAELAALQARLRDRLWLPPELARDWCAAHESTLSVVDDLRSRLAAARAGFAALPVEGAPG